MERKNIDFAVSLTKGEGWSDIYSDFTLLITNDLSCAFIAEEDRQNVAMISAICYGRFGFIGSLIVNKERRGRGIGTALMRYAIEHLERQGW